MRDPTGELRSRTRIGCSLIQLALCAVLHARTSVFGATRAYTHDNKTHVPYDHKLNYTRNDAFTDNDASFTRG